MRTFKTIVILNSKKKMDTKNFEMRKTKKMNNLK